MAGASVNDSRALADATELLNSHVSGDARASSELLPLVYARLRKLAAHYMKAERPGHSLQPTELVHEAYLRLIDGERVNWQGRTHFFAVAARQMRRVLVDHARARKAQKRDATLVSLGDVPQPGASGIVDVLALDEALTRLADASSRQADVFELRAYGGLKVNEIAEHLGVSERTVKGDWTVARTWLARELTHTGHAAHP
jgi:RNA polymerase sigma factor (TIGR02999 family)